ncbi:MAG: glycosyltransferase family 4 protein, partial [Dehalococcoidia bacterium]
MRFLIVTQYYPPEPGAAQVRLAALARELRAGGHDVEVVTAVANYPHGRISPAYAGRAQCVERIDGIRVRRLWLHAATGAGASRLASYLSFSATALAGALLGRRPDVVFVESPPLFLGVTGWLLARRWRTRLVFNVSDLWPDSVRDLGLMSSAALLGAAEALERWVYARSAVVSVATKGIGDAIVQKGVPADRVVLLPNGVDTDLFRQADADPAIAARYGLPDDGRLVLFTGNHGFAQGLDVAVQAAALLADDGVTLGLVGAGSDRARIERLVRSVAPRNVKLIPPVEAHLIPSLYGLAAAGLVTLRSSSILDGARPAKTLAVMACGRPVLYSGSGEGAELVRSADAGIVTPPEDAPALAAAIRRVVNDRPLADRLGS